MHQCFSVTNSHYHVVGTLRYNKPLASHYEMESSQPDSFTFSSPISSSASSAAFDISPSTYLRVPNSPPSRPSRSLPGPVAVEQNELTTRPLSRQQPESQLASLISAPPQSPSSDSRNSTAPRAGLGSIASREYMSVYSTSSFDTVNSEYSNPPARSYRLPNFPKMSDTRRISEVRIPQVFTKRISSS